MTKDNMLLLERKWNNFTEIEWHIQMRCIQWMGKCSDELSLIHLICTFNSKFQNQKFVNYTFQGDGNVAFHLFKVYRNTVQRKKVQVFKKRGLR